MGGSAQLARLYLDISTTCELAAFAPCKYTRIERGLANALGEDDVELVRFDPQTKVFYACDLPPANSGGASGFAHRQSAIYGSAISRFVSVERLLARALVHRLVRPWDDYPNSLRRGLGEFARIAPHLTRIQKERVERAAQFAGNKRAREDHCASTAQETAFEAGGCLLLFGAGWRHIDFETLLRLKKRHQLTVVGFIHDLIPVESPGLVTVDQHHQYRRYLLNMAAVCDRLFVPYEKTARGLEGFLESHKGVVPQIEILGLCAGLEAGAPARLSERIRSLNLESRPFVLAASAIRERKNQTFALGLWKKIRARLGARAPLLIFAGALAEPHVLFRLTADAEWASMAAYLPEPSDEELAWLYRNAQFAIQPSIRVGLGMSILEAASHGCPCICTPSHLSAGDGILVLQTRLREADWLDRTLSLLDGDTGSTGPHGRSLQTRKSRNWIDVAADLRRLIAFLGAP
jgi:glycosyltransferase involved in cell wall biosynthesis